LIAQLLLEFDALAFNDEDDDESDAADGVLVIGATNLPSSIDSGLLRPGVRVVSSMRLMCDRRC
jgi:SpoVK/Ycf46/Vps4 family AAA+-type ATPase